MAGKDIAFSNLFDRVATLAENFGEIFECKILLQLLIGSK